MTHLQKSVAGILILSSLLIGIGLYSELIAQPPSHFFPLAQASTQLKTLNPHCLSDYKDLPASPNYRLAPWAPDLLTRTSSRNYRNPMTHFIDLNGDGLIDYLYDERYPHQYPYPYEHEKIPLMMSQSCVMLNNGQGWDIAYRCATSFGTNDQGDVVPFFYGDCAKVN